eukprot:559747-Pelagomonas_calceolata.AAC.1
MHAHDCKRDEGKHKLAASQPCQHGVVDLDGCSRASGHALIKGDFDAALLDLAEQAARCASIGHQALRDLHHVSVALQVALDSRVQNPGDKNWKMRG